jgi:hypothetical protein
VIIQHCLGQPAKSTCSRPDAFNSCSWSMNYRAKRDHRELPSVWSTEAAKNDYRRMRRSYFVVSSFGWQVWEWSTNPRSCQMSNST